MQLSKSLYIRGVQCPKSLWLKKHNPDILTTEDKSVFTTGTKVGELARELFKGGKLIEFDGSSFSEKIEQTKIYIANGENVIYEATFCYDGVLVMVDILQIVDGKLIINEVKSSTSVFESDKTKSYKEHYVNDLAIQYFVLNSLGYEILKTNLVYINNTYVREDKLEVDKLFISADLTDEVLKKQGEIPINLKTFEDVLSKDEPNIDIGKHCLNPYDCDAINYCWEVQKEIPEYSIFDISGLNIDKKFKLYKDGIINFSDIKDLSIFNENQQNQIKAELNKSEYIDKEAIKSFLCELKYPLYHLDFETFQQAIPEFRGVKPYEQIPFQFSIHKECENGDLEHFSFLGEDGKDPRYDLALSLVKYIPENSCVLAYNMSFEKGVIKNLAKLFPELEDRLTNIHDNIKDLMAPFKNKHYYSYKMMGKYSIKYVLPAIVDGFEDAYRSLNLVQNGSQAMEAFSNMSSMDKQTKQEYRQALLEYCKLDTLAMVKVLDKLRQICK